ncbi:MULTISPECIES: hypothetical protein [Pseudomonas aeruginosa group]|uniref:hypothetical protein n=1 Tax=Pseudomonas aeruginosa group TaxID=136841 RepID=UPI0006B2A70D|nr:MULTISPECIES: hypothetical protein [Pseudomonas aeruginosa group]KPD29651.1 hypothetical protein AN920_11515 [Pseudomonas paraeruginosa]KQB31283.1 hypothetical protein AOA77_17600 [Pseudomonas paraeruginosa]MDT1025591.1 hypothetical protein [Pseudomonas paraeruginosa]PHJ32609.1 hypothetical protein CDG78_09145 [Pseudomonas paraeruginosa]QQV47692.1 hypothetical protein JHW37_24220 [Pseudomonas aeruginosa]
MATIDFNTVPKGVTLNEERAQYLSDRATETATAFSRKIEKLQNTVMDARNNYSREAEEFITSASPEDRATARAFAKKNAANKAANIHRQLIASSEAERAAMLKGLQAYADEAAAIQAVYTSPATMLGRVGLGDPKRTQYQLQLEGAGPVEMETAARTAIMTGNLVLGAAIATVIDRRPKDRRPFAVQAFAERVVGEVWKRMTAKLEGVQLAYKSAVAADREFVRGKADGITNLSLALSRQAIDEAAGDDGGEA